MGFTKSEVDSNLYYIIVGGQLLILVLYVENFFLIGSERLIVEFKRDLALEYEMKYLLNFHYAWLKHEVYFILFMYLNHKQMHLHHSQLFQ